MGRLLGIPVLLISLVVGAVLFTQQMKSQGPTAPTVTRAEAQAAQAVATVNFRAADELMRAYYAQNTTYAGATLDPSFQVAVARADAGSYCLQVGVGASLQHENGPGGSPAAGGC